MIWAGVWAGLPVGGDPTALWGGAPPQNIEEGCMEPSADVDAMIVDAVRNVRDRFGSDGLREMIALANREINGAERAVAGLGDDTPAAGSAAVYDSADTQAWIPDTRQDPHHAADDGD